MQFGEVLNVIFAMGIFGLLVAAGLKRGDHSPRQVADGPLDVSYQIFTREFDVELRASEVERRLMAASPDYASGHYQSSRAEWDAMIARSAAIEELARPKFAKLKEHLILDGAAEFFRGSAITLLIDQSGSMKGDAIAYVASAVRQLAQMLDELGASVEVLGFSTTGWRGGFSYQKWRVSGRPKRPGRLCALSHVVYKTHDEPVSPSTFDALLNPNLLRENVDGEAILWAAERLERRPEPRRILIVVSDGAPVDDATLMMNGPSYLTRHLMQVIDQITADNDIVLAALGINHSVADWYALSAQCEQMDELPHAVGDLLDAVAAAG